MAETPEFPHSSPDTLQRSVAGVSSSEEVTPDTKYSKDEVNYRPAGSSTTRCEKCVNFAWARGSRGNGVCQIVAGNIKPSAVCDEYESGGSGLVDLITTR